MACLTPTSGTSENVFIFAVTPSFLSFGISIYVMMQQGNYNFLKWSEKSNFRQKILELVKRRSKVYQKNM